MHEHEYYINNATVLGVLRHRIFFSFLPSPNFIRPPRNDIHVADGKDAIIQVIDP